MEIIMHFRYGTLYGFINLIEEKPGDERFSNITKMFYRDSDIV